MDPQNKANVNEQATMATCADSIVAIPRREYNDLIRSDMALKMIFQHKNEQPWDLADIAKTAYKILFPDAAVESHGDPDA